MRYLIAIDDSDPFITQHTRYSAFTTGYAASQTNELHVRPTLRCSVEKLGQLPQSHNWVLVALLKKEGRIDRRSRSIEYRCHGHVIPICLSVCVTAWP
jgi:hypothetical protein